MQPYVFPFAEHSSSLFGLCQHPKLFCLKCREVRDRSIVLHTPFSAKRINLQFDRIIEEIERLEVWVVGLAIKISVQDLGGGGQHFVTQELCELEYSFRK